MLLKEYIAANPNRGAMFMRWLVGVTTTPGYKLTELLAGIDPSPGCEADTLLKMAEAEGVIERVGWEPGPYFDLWQLGGRHGAAKKAWAATEGRKFFACGWCWCWTIDAIQKIRELGGCV